MTFVGGPPTTGPGMIVGREKAETIRSHPELQKVTRPSHTCVLHMLTEIQLLAEHAIHQFTDLTPHECTSHATLEGLGTTKYNDQYKNGDKARAYTS